MEPEPVRLAVVRASGVTSHHAFAGDRVRMGRGEDIELHVPDPEMSRLHAEIVRTAEGWVLRDCGSTNGTRRNGRTIDAPVRLRPGDDIGMGETTVVFGARPGTPVVLDRTRRADGAPAAPDALLAGLLDGTVSFWDAVAEPYLRRDLSRDAVRALVAAAYDAAGGSYKEMARILHLQGEHKRLLNFLNRHDLSVDRAATQPGRVRRGS
jgi:hypothetical protein